jgi:hypothetical protein
VEASKKNGLYGSFRCDKGAVFFRLPEILKPAPSAAFLKNATKKGGRFGPLRYAKGGRPKKNSFSGSPSSGRYKISDFSPLVLSSETCSASRCSQKRYEKGGRFGPLRHAKGGRPGKKSTSIPIPGKR